MIALLLALLLSLALGEHALAQGRVYRWTDAEGRVHYTDTPPPAPAEPSPPKAAEVPTAPEEARDRALLDAVQRGLAAGNVDAVVSLFRYFEETVGAREAATDRRVVGFFLGLVKAGFGRPGGFEAVRTPSPRYVSARIESATDAQWNASRCLFKTYALKTVFSEGATRRPGELVVSMCTGPHVEKAALRQLELRFTNPDGATTQKVRELLARAVEEARRLSAPRP